MSWKAETGVVKRFLQLRAILDNPPIHRGVIPIAPALAHEFFGVARTSG